VAPKLVPIGLIGVTRSELTGAPRDDRPYRVAPPRGPSRYLKFALALGIPAGALFAAQRWTEPEGFSAADTNIATAPATSVSRAAPDSAAGTNTMPPPPAHAFARGAFGHSDAVRVRVVLPNERLRLPIDFGGSTIALQMRWLALDGKQIGDAVLWPDDGIVTSPALPGAYWLTLSRGARTDTVADLAVLVERPMPNKRATGINGYHLGRWPATSAGDIPRGFIEVTERLSDFALSPHLRMSDFVVHDGQDNYPKYLHVRESLLDKIELMVGEIASMRGVSPAAVKLNVVSGFRSPSHNGGLSGSAQDSRHMYGDAADIGIDANSDGKLTEIDARLVAAAAEVVERKYPDLVGGVGLYITRDGEGWPYVHVDTRGVRARWRGGSRRGRVDSLPDGASFDSTGVVPPPVKPSAVTVPESTTVPATPATKLPAEQAQPVAPATERKPEVSVVRPVINRKAPSARATSLAVGGVRRAARALPTRAAKRRVGVSRTTTRRTPPPRRPSSPASSRADASLAVADPFVAAARKFRGGRP
jgi:hypothetical protein